MLKIEYWKAVPVSFLECIKWGQSVCCTLVTGPCLPHGPSSLPQCGHGTSHGMSRTCYPVLSSQSPAYLSISSPVPCSCSVFISRASVSGHGEWRGHVFCCCTSTAVTFPFYCSFVTYGLILKVVFQEILDINSHSILTDSFLPSCR